MKIEEAAALHGGVYGKIAVVGAVKRPTMRIAWVNDTPDGFVLEIAGEASDKVYVPKE